MFPDGLSRRLIQVGRRLVSQVDADILVGPRAEEQGFWFGSGNICRDRDGSLLLCGRYRNGGDSRVGLEAGTRGAELAVFRSADGGESFQHVVSLCKDDVAPQGRQVVSIEGSCLRRTDAGLELYVSSEKRLDYPDSVQEFQKPGTGIWSIDVLRASDVQGLAAAEPEPVLCSDEPCRLHVKDPVVFDLDDHTFMIYCWHPFSWTSSNTGVAEMRPDGSFTDCTDVLLPRGPAWDVTVCRVTARLALPGVGVLAEMPPVSLYFYDGAECFHDHGATGRPRGYSCEEIGGLAAGLDTQFPALTRLSVEGPLFCSPYGTGCSRYVSVYEGEQGYVATWQHSRPDGSQPLVVNRVSMAEVADILSA